MNCNTAQNLLSAYLDAELSGGEMNRLRRHLSHCDCCRREENELRALKSLLTDVPLIEPPADFEDRLCSIVFAAEREASFKEAWPLYSGLALVAAAVMMFVVTAPAKPRIEEHSKDVMALELQRDRASMAGANPFLDSAPLLNTNYVGR